MAQLAIGLFLAIFLAPLFALAPWLMALLMLPMMLAPALVGLMYRLLLQDFVGIIPYIWTLWFGDSPAFLNPGTAFWTLVTIEVLQWTPFALLILYSAYAAVPGEIREAAALDGAGPLRRLCAIDLPWMAPTIAITFFFRFIDSFRVFDNVYVLTGSGRRRQHDDDQHLHLRGLLPPQRHRRRGRRLAVLLALLLRWSSPRCCASPGGADEGPARLDGGTRWPSSRWPPSCSTSR